MNDTVKLNKMFCCLPLNAMLLNEFLKEHRKVQEQDRRLTAQEESIAGYEKRLAAQEEQMRVIADRLATMARQIGVRGQPVAYTEPEKEKLATRDVPR